MPTIAVPAGGRRRTRIASPRPRRASGNVVPRRRATDTRSTDRPLIERLRDATAALNGSRDNTSRILAS